MKAWDSLLETEVGAVLWDSDLDLGGEKGAC